MTTAIFKKWYYLAADRKYTWGISGKWENKKIKSFTTEHSEQIYFIKTWTHIIEHVLYDIVSKIFKEKFDIKKLYDLQDEIKKVDKYSFWFILLVIYKVVNYETIEEAFHITDDFIEEIQDTWCIWTWWQLATWMLLLDPECDLEKVFEKISSFDPFTSKEFDFIDLKN